MLIDGGCNSFLSTHNFCPLSYGYNKFIYTSNSTCLSSHSPLPSRSSFLSIPSIRFISPSQLHVVRSLDSGQGHGWAVLLAWQGLAEGKVGGLGPPSVGLVGLEL